MGRCGDGKRESLRVGCEIGFAENQRVGGVREHLVEIMILFLGQSFILCLPLSSDLLGGGHLALFRLMLRGDGEVTESPIKFFLHLREVPPLEGNETTLL